MTPFLLSLPWLGLLLWVLVVARIPRELPAGGKTTPQARSATSVSVIVPARDEALNIVRCLRSLAASEHPDFEIIVVDDRSDDLTAELARSVPRGNARRIMVVDGEPLPDGWLGKPWACHQGYRSARGRLLLFTDADTTHGRALLARAVAGLEEEDADLLTVAGRQLMETFWERLVQPQIFLLMLLRFPDFERVARNDRWRDAIANGQFLLFRREAYEAIGGHRAVQDEVAEDLALAQHVKRAGLRLRVRSAEHDLETRMYRSLAQLVEGWSKNIVMGGLQAFPRWLRPLVPPVSFLGGVGLWLLAPSVLALGAVGAGLGLPRDMVGSMGGGDLLVWATTVYAISAVLWSLWTRKMGGPFYLGPLYPLGAAVGSYIFLRAWLRGRSVEWKGRRYRLRPVSERA
jgi:chlorobactene glucosyltransferase